MKKILLLTLFGCVSSSLISCGILDPVADPDTTSYRINYSFDTDVQNCNIKKLPSLYVSDMNAIEPFNSKNIYYSDTEFQLKKYGYSYWSSSPVDMIKQSIVSSLGKSCLYKSVVGGSQTAGAYYDLDAKLTNLTQVYNEDQSDSNAVMEINTNLIDLHSNQVIASKVFKLKSENIGIGPKNFVKAVNAMVVTYNEMLVDWMKHSKLHKAKR